jgi:ABC1 family protein
MTVRFRGAGPDARCRWRGSPRAADGRLVPGLRETTGPAGTLDGFHERAAEGYAELLGHSKGVLMKAGQIFAMVDPGAIGNGELSPYQRALSGLQTDVPPMDPGLAKDLLEANLARSVLHDGREVAVKIQYPGAAEVIRDDLASTELLTAFFRFLSSAARTSIPDTQEATRERSPHEEIDYHHEATNISAFSQLYRDHPFIRVPEVIHDASGERVLTMTYLDGLDWPAAQHAEQDMKNAWAEVIWRFSVGSHSHANLLHAGQQVLVVIATAIQRSSTTLTNSDWTGKGRRPWPLVIVRTIARRRSGATGNHHCGLRQILTRQPQLVGPATWRDTPALRLPLTARWPFTTRL